MSLPSPARRAFLGLSLIAGLLLAGCTVTPVYNDTGVNEARLSLTYAAPTTRLEQVFYRALSERLPSSGSPLGEVSASISASSSRIGLSNASSPVSDYQMIATVDYTVTREGKTISSGQSQMITGYQQTGEKVADNSARQNAEELAIRGAAERVRLALIAELAGQ